MSDSGPSLKGIVTTVHNVRMSGWRVADATLNRLYRDARAERWRTPRAAFAEAIERSARRSFPEAPPARDLDRYAESLRAEDLALACACAAGDDAAWEHFVREYRPILYRSADALDPTGGARDLADSLYGELFGLRERDGERRSHFDYFHGRSSLATWLRAVLAQRHVDRIRSRRRLDPLPDEEGPGTLVSTVPVVEPQRLRYLELMRRAVATALARLQDRDRLRLNCYYAEGLTLAQIGRALGEHEATVSRQLARSRRALRRDVEATLREQAGMAEGAIADCFSSVVSDAGSLTLADWFDAAPLRKKAARERSK